MKRNCMIIILLAAVITVPAYSQTDVSDMSETFKIFEEARSLTAGYDLTSKDFIPTIPEGYLLGPGDILEIMAGSMFMDVGVLQVSPNGKILVPPAGFIEVEGLTIAEAENKIKSELAIYLKDPSIQIDLLQAKKVKVYLTGQVMLPGIYITFAGATPTEFLQVAGNLVTAPTGLNLDEGDFVSPYLRSLTASASRYVHIIRDGQDVAEVDLAAVLRKADTSSETIYLRDGDVVFVPESKRPVLVRGGVVHPGKYEFDRHDSLGDVILMAGGARTEQFIREVVVERETEFGKENLNIALDLNLKPVDPGFKLHPGDIVRVPEASNFVYVLGGLWLPAAVEYREGWHVLDYIAQTGGPTAPADPAVTLLIRNPGMPDAEVIQCNFKEMYMGNEANNPVVGPGDLIWVPYKDKQWSGPGITGTILQFATFARFLWN